MHYAKNKRERKSICNICRSEADLSWDHVPPKGGITLTPIEMKSVFGNMLGNRTAFSPESQNGMKYRTICNQCNASLGKYDRTLNEFALSIGKCLTSTVALPSVLELNTRPQTLMKAVIGHLLAAKVNIENTEFDRLAQEYVLDPDMKLPDDFHLFYWIYPYSSSVVIREFAMFWPRGTLNEPAIFQTLKYFPIAYLCCDKPDYSGLPALSEYRECKLDDNRRIRIELNRIEDSDWPEAPSADDNNHVILGKSASNAIRAKPKQPRT
ncbi:MAG: hypothetical protein ACTSYJ_12570 [Candidatus Thorarchaeota archaeon]